MSLLSQDGVRSTKSLRMFALERSGCCATPSYMQDTRKESQCKEYLRHFQRRFHATNPSRRNLFLMPTNEYRIEKFVCTTLRPTFLPLRQLYDVSHLSAYIAHYLQYEPLESFNEMPKVLPSPTQVGCIDTLLHAHAGFTVASWRLFRFVCVGYFVATGCWM